MSLRPVLRLTGLGKQVMKGERAMEFRCRSGLFCGGSSWRLPTARRGRSNASRTDGSEQAERDAPSVCRERTIIGHGECGRPVSCSECAAIRQLEPDTVEEHLRQAR